MAGKSAFTWRSTLATYTYLAGSGTNSTTAMLSTIAVNGVTWKYEYDDNGNITKIYKNNVLDKEYTYDVLNQLTKEVDKATGTTTTYTYDKQGNLTGAGNHTYTYGDSKGWSDLLTTYDGSGIAYDNIGNPTIYRDFSMTWQNGRELASLTKNSKTFTYAYNDSGIRTSKTVNGHTNAIYLSGDAIVRENPTGNISLTYLYDESGTRYGFLYKNGSTSSYYYYVYNGQGDVTEIVDSNGNKVAQYTYNAWGLPLSVKDGSGNAVSATNTTHIANLNPFRYRGYYYDNESGFYYLQSRYYDPQTGRFINADGYVSTGQGILGNNMFVYCGNNPVNRADPSGHFWGEIWEFIKTAISEIGQAMTSMSPAYAACGGAIVADGPLPFGDMIAIAGAATVTMVAIGYGIYEATKASATSVPKAKEKDITAPPPSQTKIYRYGGTNPGNLTPREKDQYTGLSFSTVPKPGAAMTTIEEINATGIVYAVTDGANHVSVRPVGGTIKDWIDAGSSSKWTQAVKSVVVKWDGAN